MVFHREFSTDPIRAWIGMGVGTLLLVGYTCVFDGVLKSTHAWSILDTNLRIGDRVADGTALLMLRTGNRTEGSNPSLSALPA